MLAKKTLFTRTTIFTTLRLWVDPGATLHHWAIEVYRPAIRGLLQFLDKTC
jgi:hypothetical protein